MKLKTQFPVEAAANGTTSSTDLRGRISQLYTLAQSSDFIFGSPLGPLPGGQYALPQFVYFGPGTSDASPRLAVLAGLGRHDLPAARALAAFVGGLARQPDLGHGLNVSFFPVVNVIGLLGGAEDRDLSRRSWLHAADPEIALLAQDARVRQYQGYIRVVTTTDDEPAAWLRSVVSPFIDRSGIEVFNSADFDPWAVRFESVPFGSVTHGPLSLSEELPVAPFEVELALPADWPQSRADAALGRLLKRLLTRYRGFLAFGQNL